MQDASLIVTVAAGFTGAWALGLLSRRIGLSPIVGYLVAGVLIGKHTPGFVGDLHIAQQLAEVGVILLMFGVGLHFHLKDLLAVRNVAIPGAVVQSLAATVVAMLLFHWLGLPYKTGAVIGMAMAVASTVVLMRVLMDADALSTPQGHVAVGWLIVEDVFTVILLVIIPVLGEPVAATASDAAAAAAAAATTPAATPSVWVTLGIALLKLAALVVVVLVVGARTIPWVLVRVARLRSRELFTLTVLVFSIAIAAGSYYAFGASMALGAFLAGMVVAQSPVSHQAAADALPMRDAFAVLFFVSVGMLFDPSFVVREPLMMLAALAVILVAKPLAALLIVFLLGHSVRTALTVALGLAQIGEFSFILSDLARLHGLMPESGHNVLVGSAILSITLNPFLFRSLPKVEAWLHARPKLWAVLNGRADRRAAAANTGAAARATQLAAEAGRLAVVIGYGPVGRSVNRLLRDAGLRTVVIDLNMDTVQSVNSEEQPAIFGDASHEGILEQAGVKRATHVVITLPDAGERAAVVAAVRNLNPAARILVRARYLRERDDLERAGASAAVFEEAEAAVALSRLVLADAGVKRDAAERKVRDLRFQLVLENLTGLRSQRVRSVMVPWSRVRTLGAATPRDEVLRLVAGARFSRWPVTDGATGRVTGYLLAKDLIAGATDGAAWTTLVRPLQTYSPDDDVESTLVRMQREGSSIGVVEEKGVPVGLITLEDVLEQVVGRLEDEYPRDAAPSLAAALSGGGFVPHLQADSAEAAIRTLAAAIPADRLPPGGAARVASLALAREAEYSTDLGDGVAIPHARCPGLAAPLVVLGRSADGIRFSSASPRPVRLVFLLLTPAEEPDVQLSMLSQLAALASDGNRRSRLLAAETASDVLSVVAPTG